MPPVFRLVFRLLILLAALAPAFARAQPNPITVSARFDRASTGPGDQAVLAVIIDMEEHWHLNTQDPQPPPGLGLEPIPTTITVTPPKGAKVGPLQWPKPSMMEVAAGQGKAKYGVFEHRAIVLLPVVVDGDAGGELTFKIDVGYQACDESTCLPPEEETVEATLKVDPAATPLNAWSGDFASFDPASFLQVSSAGTPAGGTAVESAPAAAASTRIPFNVFGWKFSIDPSGVSGLTLLALIAVVGGFILNLTPCVLPVVPLKIVALSQGAKSPRRTLFLGAMMCLGIIAFWLAIGTTIALSTSFKSASTIISNWWFAVGMGVFMAAMGLSMFGAFTVGLPNWVYAANPRHDTVHGSFLFGILTAVLATPCVAPLGGTAMGWAAFQPAAKTLLVFSAIGVGMALPYIILAANPAWVSRVPRAGPASELIKQIMGILMFAVAAFFIGAGFLTLQATMPWIGSVVHWWFVGGFCVIAAVWLVFRAWQLGRTRARVITTVLGLVLAYSGIGLARYFTNTAAAQWAPTTGAQASHGVWQRYTPEAFNAAIAANKVVVAEFTAEWCIICKTLESQVLNTPKVQAALASPDVVAFKVDLTAKTTPDGKPTPDWQYLYSLQEVGPPVLVIYGPGRADPYFKSNAYTIAVVVSEIDGSRSPRLGAAGPTNP